MTGEVWRISGVDFYRWIMKDKTTVSLMQKNLSNRLQNKTKAEEHRHDEFKYHNIEVKEVDSVLDD